MVREALGARKFRKMGFKPEETLVRIAQELGAEYRGKSLFLSTPREFSISGKLSNGSYEFSVRVCPEGKDPFDFSAGKGEIYLSISIGNSRDFERAKETVFGFSYDGLRVCESKRTGHAIENGCGIIEGSQVYAKKGEIGLQVPIEDGYCGEQNKERVIELAGSIVRALS